MLQIRDILVRIRIRGSLPLANGSGSGSGSFFCLLLFQATFASFFKDKKSGSHKTVEIKVFLTIFLRIVRSGSGSVPRTNPDPDQDPGGLKHMDPTLHLTRVMNICDHM